MLLLFLALLVCCCECVSLEERLDAIEAKEQVRAAMYKMARWLDRVELTDVKEDVEYVCHNLMTPEGYFHMGAFGAEPTSGKQHCVEFLAAFQPAFKWALHLFWHEEVHLSHGNTRATFHAQEVVPSSWDGVASSLFLENDSSLHLVDGVWRVHKYGVYEAKDLKNAASSWPEIAQNPDAWMFQRDKMEHPGPADYYDHFQQQHQDL